MSNDSPTVPPPNLKHLVQATQGLLHVDDLGVSHQVIAIAVVATDSGDRFLPVIIRDGRAELAPDGRLLGSGDEAKEASAKETSLSGAAIRFPAEDQTTNAESGPDESPDWFAHSPLDGHRGWPIVLHDSVLQPPAPQEVPASLSDDPMWARMWEREKKERQETAELFQSDVFTSRALEFTTVGELKDALEGLPEACSVLVTPDGLRYGAMNGMAVFLPPRREPTEEPIVYLVPAWLGTNWEDDAALMDELE